MHIIHRNWYLQVKRLLHCKGKVPRSINLNHTFVKKLQKSIANYCNDTDYGIPRAPLLFTYQISLYDDISCRVYNVWILLMMPDQKKKSKCDLFFRLVLLKRTIFDKVHIPPPFFKNLKKKSYHILNPFVSSQGENRSRRVVIDLHMHYSHFKSRLFFLLWC